MSLRALLFAQFVLGSLMLAGCQQPERAASVPTPAPRPTMPPVQRVAPPVPLVADRLIAPGVRWRQYSGTSKRWKAPLFANVLEFDPRDPRYRVAVIQAQGKAPSYRESTRRIAAKSGAIAAINGSYFEFQVRRSNGDPIGLVLSEGALVNAARGDRPALGIMPDGRVFFGTPSRKRDAAAALQLERLAGLRETAVAARPPEAPGSLLERTMLAIGRYVPRQSAVAATRSLSASSPYRNATGLGAPWDGALHGLEGGPLLVHDGKRVPLRGFNWSILKGREPRTAVGLTREGKMVWITIDGRRPGHSMGTDLDEVTQLFLSLGAVEALNWDGGGSTTMVIKGQPVTKIATGWVREVSNALVLIPAKPPAPKAPATSPAS